MGKQIQTNTVFTYTIIIKMKYKFETNRQTDKCKTTPVHHEGSPYSFTAPISSDQMRSAICCFIGNSTSVSVSTSTGSYSVFPRDRSFHFRAHAVHSNRHTISTRAPVTTPTASGIMGSLDGNPKNQSSGRTKSVRSTAKGAFR